MKREGTDHDRQMMEIRKRTVRRRQLLGCRISNRKEHSIKRLKRKCFKEYCILNYSFLNWNRNNKQLEGISYHLSNFDGVSG